MTSPLPPPSFAASTNGLYRAAFAEAVSSGRVRPFVLPYAAFVAPTLPVLYLAIPHARRPWLYSARWLVLAAVAAAQVEIALTMSSTNMAMGYAVGLLASGWVLQTAYALVCSRPQFDAERVQRRRRGGERGREGGGVVPNGKASGVDFEVRSNGEVEAKRKGKVAYALDEDVLRYLPEYEYYWEPYPADGSFWERIVWSVDFMTALRGQGWRHAIRNIPMAPKPEKPFSGELVDIRSMPIASTTGCSRPLTRRGFYGNRLVLVIVAYVYLDICSSILNDDPYFVAGPHHGQPLPRPIDQYPPWLLSLGRNLISLAAVILAIQFIFALGDILSYSIARSLGSVQGELWRFPSYFGHFMGVLDDGLAGFWGTWWHQTFRLIYVGPTKLLIRNGRLRRGSWASRAVCCMLAFLQSGFLHSTGSFTTIPQTDWYKPTLFFLFQGLGVLVQEALSMAAPDLISRMPTTVKRIGNFVFAAAFLQATAWLLIDDFTQSGLFLYEAVPVSVIRLLGLGRAGEGWWRWDKYTLPHIYIGKHWWDSGIGF